MSISLLPWPLFEVKKSPSLDVSGALDIESDRHEYCPEDLAEDVEDGEEEKSLAGLLLDPGMTSRGFSLLQTRLSLMQCPHIGYWWSHFFLLKVQNLLASLLMKFKRARMGH